MDEAGQDQLVIVSGGSRGLGLAILGSLLNGGFRVAVCSRSGTKTPELAALQERWGNERVFHAPLDVSDTDAVPLFVKACCDWADVRRPFGLVNNAGIARDGILASLPSIDIRRMTEINLIGAIEMARAAVKLMLRYEGPGRIINISSIIGSHGYNGLAAYAATKAGLDGFTRSMAREVGRRGITVNSVAPGYLETEMSASLAPERRQQIIRRTPLGRLGTVDDVTPLVRFLLSREAAFITGQIITVDGGINA